MTSVRKLAQLKAAEKGEKTFFTGEECINGHIDRRYTSNGKCVSCVRNTTRRQNLKKNPESIAIGKNISDEIRDLRKQRSKEKRREFLKTPEGRKKVKEYNKKSWSKATQEQKAINRERALIWYKNNKYKKKAYDTKYRSLNKDKERTWRNNWKKKQFLNKTDYVIKERISKRIRQALKSQKVRKDNSALFYLGCSIEDARIHIESKFAKNMNWENYGEWELDHIRPCASFDLKKESEQLKCFNFKNLQPLWKKDNRKKSDKW